MNGRMDYDIDENQPDFVKTDKTIWIGFFGSLKTDRL
jgi:hypothetical protein